MCTGNKIHVTEDLGKGDIYLCAIMHGFHAYRTFQSYAMAVMFFLVEET